METLAIVYRLLQLVLLVLGIVAIVSKREVSSRAIITVGVVVIAVLTIGTGISEALRIGVPMALLGYVFGATALFFGLPGVVVTLGAILLRHDRQQIWLRVGVLTALYFVAAHVGLKLVTHVAIASAAG
jgi:hypothetical protein